MTVQEMVQRMEEESTARRCWKKTGGCIHVRANALLAWQLVDVILAYARCGHHQDVVCIIFQLLLMQSHNEHSSAANHNAWCDGPSQGKDPRLGESHALSQQSACFGVDARMESTNHTCAWHWRKWRDGSHGAWHSRKNNVARVPPSKACHVADRSTHCPAGTRTCASSCRCQSMGCQGAKRLQLSCV